jgi:isoleucyl-tRNA synthetase
VPKWAGENQFHKWLEGIRDWCITRQRFWGVPLPIWQCDKCGSFEVIGSRDELKKLAGFIPEDLHKPLIDTVSWPCKCGGRYVRNPDIIDVWIDSACAPFASLPLPREEWMKKLGKMNFTIEAKDQIRGWFYSLMGIGVVSFGECPYTNIFMHAFLTDENGQKLSKRKGNYISMPELFNTVGADVFRTSLMSSLTPGIDSKFVMDEVKNTYKTLNVIWSTHDFILRNLKYYKVKPGKPVVSAKEDEWLLSRLN